MSYFNIVLVAPEIPQNTGSIGRLCVCTDCRLHLIRPLGFSLDDSHLRRAGMDYWQYLDLSVYDNWEAFLERNHPERMFFCSTKTERPLYSQRLKEGDWLVFGNEGHGLSEETLSRCDATVRIPMASSTESLNAAAAAAVLLWEYGKLK